VLHDGSQRVCRPCARRQRQRLRGPADEPQPRGQLLRLEAFGPGADAPAHVAQAHVHCNDGARHFTPAGVGSSARPRRAVKTFWSPAWPKQCACLRAAQQTPRIVGGLCGGRPRGPAVPVGTASGSAFCSGGIHDHRRPHVVQRCAWMPLEQKAEPEAVPTVTAGPRGRPPQRPPWRTRQPATRAEASSIAVRRRILPCWIASGGHSSIWPRESTLFRLWSEQGSATDASASKAK
jgi:hypothetical protein